MLRLQQERVDKEIGISAGGVAAGSKRNRKKSSGSDPFGGSDEDLEEEEEFEGEEDDDDEEDVVGPSINPASFNVDAQRTLLRIRQKLQGLVNILSSFCHFMMI